MNRKDGIRVIWMRGYMRISLIAWVIVLLTACSSASPSLQSDRGIDPLQVTTTTGMIADIVSQIGQEHVKVTGLMGPGVDPHLYKASQGDIKKIDQAQIIFYNGLHLEGKMEEIFVKINKMKPVIAVSRDIDPQVLRYLGEGVTEVDPHIWFNVALWMQATETVRDALIEIDPSHTADYEANTRAYLDELVLLDQSVREQIARIPLAQRILITAHDAFGYFGDAYGLQVRGLQGMSTAGEFGSRDVIELREFIIEKQVRAVFVESSVPQKSIEAVIQGAKKLGHQVVIGGDLYSDAMGPADTSEGTYIGMVKHNVETIVNALK